MPEGDPAHQFQMMLRPIENALRAENLEAALRFTGQLLEIGGTVTAFQDRKIHVLLRAMEGATPSVKTSFTAGVLDRFGAQLSEDARARLEGRLERL